MTKKTHTGTTAEASWEEAVTRYLAEHPDYLVQHPELLVDLKIPHLGRGRSVSLIEKQVEVLREKNRALQKQLKELVRIARDNEALAERLHRYTVAVSDAATVDDLISTTRDWLRDEFEIDAAVIVLGEAVVAAVDWSDFLVMDDTLFASVMGRLGGERTVCDNRTGEDQFNGLFPALPKPVASVALVALGGAAPWGALVLAATDRDRFRPDMGTVYLGRFGEILAGAMRRFLDRP